MKLAVGVLGIECASASEPTQDVSISDACSITRVPTLSLETFVADYKGRRPIIFSRSGNVTAAAQAMTTREWLESSYGDNAVVLASSNSFSYDKRRTTLRTYLSDYLIPRTPANLANESWYLFGDTPASEGFQDLVDAYPLPMDSADDNGIVAWGVGARFSGVSFHTHGAAFAETTHGRKRWYLSAPDDRPDFDQNVSQLQWVLQMQQEAARSAASGRRAPNNDLGSDSDDEMTVDSSAASIFSSRAATVYECTAHPGEVIYIPPQWWHATLNLDDWNAFFSVFTQEPFALQQPAVAAPFASTREFS